MVKVNQDPFSNGEEFRWWSARNCDKCIKSPKMVVSDLVVYTKCRCAIYRDIELRTWSDEPISKRTINICNLPICPYRKEHWPARKHKRKSKTANLPSLFKEEQL